MKPYFETELGKLYNCDCLEFMKDMPDNSVGLVLTDPPYGIKADKGTDGYGNSKHTVKKYNDSWDSKTPSAEYFIEILRTSKLAMIFGGNYFTDKLPMSRGWIVWDKVGEMKFNNPYSKCELIWTNKDMVCQKYVCIQMGFVSKEKERFHPTQKPVMLISNIINDYIDDGVVFDPFLGSGTTAVACEKLNRRWIGIEISEKYCEIAAKRISAEANQGKLFT